MKEYRGMHVSASEPRRYRIGGEELSKEEAIQKFLPLVKHLARRQHRRLPSSVDLDDMVNDGVVGLIDALEKYDDARDLKFETYAIFRINGAILDGVRSLDWVPRLVRDRTRQVENVYKQLETDLGRTPSTKEVADRMNITAVEVSNLSAQLQCSSVRSLDEGVSPHRNSDVTLADVVRDTSKDVSWGLRRNEAKRELVRAVQQLPSQERTVISLHYFKGTALNEIAKILGVSAPRISQIRKKAIASLREKFRAARLLNLDHYEDLIA
jgi:RNA polymerase sigma factor FliA